jgi:hypothetical protein
MTCLGTGEFTSTLFDRKRSTCSTTRGRSWNTDPSTRRPSFAIVAYARAMSSALTAPEPSPIEK